MKLKSSLRITIIITIIIILTMILYAFNIPENRNDQEHDITINNEIISFSISIDKNEFSINESINITTILKNDYNKSVTISRYKWYRTLNYTLWDYYGNEIKMGDWHSVPNIWESITLNPGECYEEESDIKLHFG